MSMDDGKPPIGLAYDAGYEIVIIGEPPDDKSLPEDEQHNCDAMGCSTLYHTLYRFRKPISTGDGEKNICDGLFAVVKTTRAGVWVMSLPDALRRVASLSHITDEIIHSVHYHKDDFAILEIDSRMSEAMAKATKIRKCIKEKSKV